MKKEKKKEKESQVELITPLKNFEFSFNGKKLTLKKGKEVEVDKIFLKNLKTEKVI